MYGSTKAVDYELGPMEEVYFEKPYSSETNSKKFPFSILAGLSAVAVTAGSLLVLNNGTQFFKSSTVNFQQDSNALTMDGIKAPLVFQSIDNEDVYFKFLEKYGLDGKGAASTTEVLNFAGMKGWAYSTIYPHGNCAGVEYSVGGLMTGQCYALDSESKHDDLYTDTSVMFGCAEGSVVMNKYKGTVCKEFEQALNLTTTDTCGYLVSDAWNSVDTGKAYGMIQCSQENELPLSGDYAVMKVFDDKSPAVFEALKMDTCIAIDWNDVSQSVVVRYDEDTEVPSMEYFDSSSSCAGTASSTLELSSDEKTLTGSAVASITYKWEYWGGGLDSTYAPTLAPTTGVVVDTTNAPIAEPEFTPSPTASPVAESAPTNPPIIGSTAPTASPIAGSEPTNPPIIGPAPTSSPVEELGPVLSAPTNPPIIGSTAPTASPIAGSEPTNPPIIGPAPTSSPIEEVDPVPASLPTSAPIEEIHSGAPTSMVLTYHPTSSPLAVPNSGTPVSAPTSPLASDTKTYHPSSPPPVAQ